MLLTIKIYDSTHQVIASANATFILHPTHHSEEECLSLLQPVSMQVSQAGRAEKLALFTNFNDTQRLIYEGKIGTRLKPGVAIALTSCDLEANSILIISCIDLQADPSFVAHNIYLRKSPQGSLVE
jgi:hypothetical protein